MANKKITELPFITTLTGSSVFDNPSNNTVVPVVLYGTTNQITVENFAKYINLYNAHTGSAGNTFTGPQTINNNVTINGRLTVNEVVAQYETASILFSTGSTKLGDQLTDKHEFTGSTNITGSLTYNGVIVGNIDANTIYRLQQTTQSLQVATASLQAHSASVDSQLLSLQQTTQSLQVSTASLNTFTASQDSRNFVISQYTASTDVHIVGIAAFTSSQLAVNLGNSIYTASVDSHIVGISTYTASVRDTLARVYQSTASLQQFTASQDSRNFVVSQVTGSLIGITNGLMAFTAALDNTYATDAQLYQLYQATRSLEIYTGSNESWKDGIRGEVSAIEAYTASLKGQAIVSSSTQVQNYDVFALNSNLYTSTGSLIGITNGLMAFTASLDSTYATDAQLYQLYAATASLNTFSSSIRSEINLLEAYTASLKAAAIVSSSTQISNYYKFAETASANTFYGNQTFNNDVRANKFVFTDGVINTNVGGQYVIATSGNVTYLYTGTSGLNINDATNGNINVSISNVGAVQTRGKLTVGSPGNDQDIAFGGSNAKLDWAATGAQIGYNVGALQFSSVGTTNNMILQQQAGALFNAGITGSLMATNNVVSSSTQIQNYSLFAVTSSANTFYGNQKVKGNLDIDNKVSVTGSLIVSSSTNQLWATPEFQLYNGLGTVNFALTPNTGNQLQIQAYGTKAEILQANEPLRLLTPTLQMVKYDNTPTKVEVTGSLNVTGSIRIASGSITMPNRPAFRVVGTSTSDRTGVYTMSGSNFTIDYNEGNHFNITNGKFTAPIAGLYQVYLNARCGSVNAQQQIIVYKNGTAGTTQLMWEAPGNTGVAHFGVSGIVKLAAGDTLEATITVGSISFDGNDSWGVTYIG